MADTFRDTTPEHKFVPVPHQTGCARCGYARGHHPRASVVIGPKGHLAIPGYRLDPTYIVRLTTGAYFVRADRGPDGTTLDRRAATRFLVRDGEWNADGWARRLLGSVEVF